MFACIGEQFRDLPLAGVNLSKRHKGYYLGVWIENAKDSDIVEKVSTKFKSLVEISLKSVLFFKLHKNAMEVRFALLIYLGLFNIKEG